MLIFVLPFLILYLQLIISPGVLAGVLVRKHLSESLEPNEDASVHLSAFAAALGVVVSAGALRILMAIAPGPAAEMTPLGSVVILAGAAQVVLGMLALIAPRRMSGRRGLHLGVPKSVWNHAGSLWLVDIGLGALALFGTTLVTGDDMAPKTLAALVAGYWTGRFCLALASRGGTPRADARTRLAGWMWTASAAAVALFYGGLALG